MKRKEICLIMFSVVGLCSCASLKGNVPFQYQPSIVKGKQIDAQVGMSMMIDNRPTNDRKNTKSIKDIDEKVTSKIIEDFSRSQLYTKIHYGSDDNDTIHIEGEIRRFAWSGKPNPLFYIPFINLLTYLGIPVYKMEGTTEIALSVQDKATGTSNIYQGSSKVTNTYSVYHLAAGEDGAELSESFRNAIKSIKDQLTAGTTREITNTVSIFHPLSKDQQPGFSDETFSIHLLGSMPFYTVNYIGSLTSAGTNLGTYSFNGNNSGNNPSIISGASIRIYPQERVFISFNGYQGFSQDGTLRAELSWPGVGIRSQTLTTTVTQEVAFGCDIDYLIYAKNRKKIYAGIGILRSAFSYLRNGYLNLSLNNNSGDYMTIHKEGEKTRKEVDTFLLNSGFEWKLTDSLGFALNAYIPFSKNPVIENRFETYFSHTTNQYEADVKQFEMKNSPIVANLSLSYYFN